MVTFFFLLLLLLSSLAVALFQEISLMGHRDVNIVAVVM